MKNHARTAPLARGRAERRPIPPMPYILGLFAIVLLALATATAAQDINESVTIEDLGFTSRLLGGARPTGLAGAYAGLGVDAHSLIYNPAGLVGVDKTEFHLGFQHQKWSLKNAFYGTPSLVEPSATRFDDLVIAAPIPTVRGRLVVAGGVYRAYSSDIDIVNRGFNTDTSTEDDYLLQQSGSIYSYNFGAAIDLAPTLSIGANVFFLNGRVNALTQFTYEFVPAPPPTPRELERQTLVDDAVVDVNGIGAVFGFLYQPSDPLSIGIAVGTPTALFLRGDAVQDDALYYSSPPDEFFQEAFAIDTDYKLPFYAEAGVSIVTRHFIATAEAEYTNWAEAEINGRQVKDNNLQAIFRDVVNVRGGLELMFGPLSLRGGYALTPYPLEYLQADRIEGTQLQKAVVTDDLHLMSAGIGLTFADALTLDLSGEYQTGQRIISTLIDTRESYRFVLAASFRI